MSSSRRPLARRIVVPAVVLLVALLALWLVVLRDHRPPFATGDATESSTDGEGLMGDRRVARATVGDPHFDEPLVVQLSAPGSRVVGFRVITLDADADPVRIRQVTSADVDVDRSPARVSWRGYVATQAQGDRSDIRRRLGPWRAAPPAGILVRPGQTVRLRTRYDLREPAKPGACWEVTLGGAPPWLVRKDGDDGDWKALRTRDDDGDEHHDVRVRTGQEGPLQLRSGVRGCRGTDGLSFDFDPDGGD